VVSFEFYLSFIKRRLFITSLVLLIFLFGTLPAWAQLTAYKHYNNGLGTWDYTLSTSSLWTDIYGSGSIDFWPSGKGDFPADNPAFGGCVGFSPSTVLYHWDYDGVIWNDAEGTISVWVAPAWNGENQGGVHPNGTGNDIITGDGIAEIPCTQGFNVLFFDNNVAPGYQLFVCYTDNGGAVTYENYPLGNTMDWIAGEWHHVCVSWDATEVMAGLDGTIFMKNARNGGFNFAKGGYLFGMMRTAWPENSWDGWADDLAVYDTALYTGYGNVGEPYPVPTEPATTPAPLFPEPNSPQEVWDWGFGMENDLFKDCYINFFDFAVFANNGWSFLDLAVFVNDWLRSNHPDDPDGEKPWDNITPCPMYPGNILANPSFEESSDISAAFWDKDYGQMTGEYEYHVAGNAHTGDKCLAITGTVAGMARWYIQDVYLVEGAGYHLSCWVKTEGTGVSGTVNFPDGGVTVSFGQTPTWTYIDRYFMADSTSREAIFLVSNGLGTVFFDDISIEMIQQPLYNTEAAITTNGQRLRRIVIPDDCNMADYYLAFDARRILKEMTGIEIAVETESTVSTTMGGLYISCAPDMSAYAADLASVGDEGIVLDINPDNIICLGNTARGVYYAVQELFYVLGCRWYTPWDGGECIPNTPTLTLPYQKIIHEPSFKLRGGKICQTYHFPPDMDVRGVYWESWCDWAGRNKMNNINASYPDPWDYGSIRGYSAQDWAGHTIHTIINPTTYFADHPEYFPEVNYPEGTVERTYMTPWAGRPGNVCVSNPEVIQICADFVIDYFDTHPFADRIHIGQMDVGAHCECASCKALDPPGSVEWSRKAEPPIAVLVFTDRWLWFINQIADIVKLAHPTKYVATYAYAETLTLPINPDNYPRDNVMIELTWSQVNLQDNSNWRPVRCYKHDMNDPTCPSNVEGMQVLTDWAALAPVSIYSYYLYYNNAGTAGAYCHHDAGFYRALYDVGVRHINDEIGTDTLAAPLLLNLRARLLWDINTDVDQYIDDFCNNVYGPAAIPVKQFFTALEETVSKSTKTHVYFNDFDLFTPAIIAELNGYLDSAETIAAGDTTLLARIARLRISLIYTEIKTLTNPAEIDALQAEAYSLIQTYNIPVGTNAYGVLAP